MTVPDAIGFHRTPTSDVTITLSGLALGTLTRDELIRLNTALTSFLKDATQAEIFSPPIKLPHKREQERIILSTSLPEIGRSM